MSIRTGLIGYGLAGRIFHLPFLLAAGMEIRAVATSRAAEIERDLPGADCESDPIRLIDRDDLDLVVIATPNASHFPLAKAALEAGKHVVVDKPFTLNTREADDLIAVAEKCNRLLTVFHNRRWDSDFLTLGSCLGRGDLGEVVSYQCRYDRYRPEVRDRWREHPEPGSGLLFDLGSHLIDQALVLFGRPDWLIADIFMQRPGAETDDGFHLLMGKGRLRIVLAAGSLVAAPEPRFVVHGSRGSFLKSGSDVQEQQLRDGAMPDHAGFGEEPPEQQAHLTIMQDGVPQTRTVPSCPGRYVDFYRDVRDAIEAKAALPVTAREARDVINIIELAFRSHHEGRRIELPED